MTFGAVIKCRISMISLTYSVSENTIYSTGVTDLLMWYYKQFNILMPRNNIYLHSTEVDATHLSHKALHNLLGQWVHSRQRFFSLWIHTRLFALKDQSHSMTINTRTEERNFRLRKHGQSDSRNVLWRLSKVY